ncbi:MAG: hypothetical protein WCT85_03165 [Parachlamydiales bacterium]|jgi:hypothetical protein
MSAEKKYKSLINDTICYLQDLEFSNFEPNSIFYSKPENKKLSSVKKTPNKTQANNNLSKTLKEVSANKQNPSIKPLVKETKNENQGFEKKSTFEESKTKNSIDSIASLEKEEKKELMPDESSKPKDIKSLNEKNSLETSKSLSEKNQLHIYDNNILDRQINAPFINSAKISENNDLKTEDKSDNDKLSKQSNAVLETKKIIRETKPSIIEDNFNDIKNVLKKIQPNLILTDEIPDDKTAKQKAQKYKFKNISSPITILAYKENEDYYKFLEKLSIALNIYFMPTKVVSAYLIEKQNNWEAFFSENEINLIISSDYTVFELPILRKHYKENPSQQEKYLKEIPLFLLPDISIYFKEPSLKLSLFKAIEKKVTEIKK